MESHRIWNRKCGQGLTYFIGCVSIGNFSPGDTWPIRPMCNRAEYIKNGFLFLYILLVIDSDVDSLNPSGSGRYAQSRE